MAPGKRSAPATAATAFDKVPTSPRQHAARVIEAVAFFVLLLVVAMRPLISETYDAQRHAIDRAVGLAAVVTPATTAWFNLAIWGCAAAVAVAVILGQRRWRMSGLELGLLAMIVAALISTWPTSNQRIAMNASADWLTGVVLLMTIVQLARVRWRAALILTVIVASGLTAATRCGMQKGVEFRETIAEYERTKEDFWRQQGIAPDAPEVELFERRLAAREASGFFPYSNVQAAGLSLAGFSALALLATVAASPGRWIIGAIVAAILFASILMTGGTGALLASMAGLMLWWFLRRTQAVWKTHWRSALLVAGVVALLATIGLVGWGRWMEGLPHASLDFRWNYWQATSEMIADHPWTGVGALNFDRAYLGYKPIEYPEEIRDPHNIFISITAQWGILGGIGLLACIVGGAWVWARRESRVPVARTDQPHRPVRPVALWWAMGLVPAFLILRLIVLRPMLADGLEGQAFVMFDVGLYGLLWCLLIVALTYLITDMAPPKRDSANPPPSAGTLRGPDRIALACGVVAFLIQDTISFAMFYPGTLTPLAAMGGVLLSHPAPTAKPGRWPWANALPLVVAVVGLAAYFAWVFLPATRTARWMAEARTAAGEQVIQAYERAAAADPRNPAPLIDLALWHAAQVDQPSLDRAVDALRQAILRDPDQLLLYRYQAQVLVMRYQVSGATSDMLASIGAARKAVSMYPSSPDVHLDLAELLDMAAVDWRSPPLRDEALWHYGEALRLNQARPGLEIRRWSDTVVQDVQDRMEQLRAMPLDESPPDTPDTPDTPDALEAPDSDDVLP